MTKCLWNALKLSPVILAASLLLANRVQAVVAPIAQLAPNSSTTVTSLPTSSLKSVVSSVPSEKASVGTTSQPAQNTEPTDTLSEVTSVAQLSTETPGSEIAQVTSVSQLSDVQPTDWAFQALQSLVERYGCIVGYPDSTYRGNRALTRYEFAAGLNSCLDRVNELIAAGTADLVRREDLATLQRLQEEFSAEVATLRGRVDGLEAQTAELEANQFSTTTKLNGEAIFAVADTFGDATEEFGDGDEGDQTSTIFAARVRLNFDTSFSGRDLLRTRLQARNIEAFDDDFTGTDMTRLGFDGNENNTFALDDFFYRFPIGDRARVFLAITSFEPRDFIDVASPFVSSGEGAISRFGRLNPILRIPDDSSGLGLDFKLSDALIISGGYLVDTGLASDPSEGAGLFNGQYAAFGNVLFNASSTFKLGLSYVRSYAPGGEVNLTGGTGSELSQDPLGVATSGNSVGAQAQLGLSDKLILSGWFGYTWANAQADGVGVNEGDEARIANWAAAVSFPDLIKQGSLASIIFGQPPKVVNSDLVEDDDTSYHLEGFLRFPITENISITPGVFVVFNPEHNSDNSTQYVGTIRTTLEF